MLINKDQILCTYNVPSYWIKNFKITFSIFLVDFLSVKESYHNRKKSENNTPPSYFIENIFKFNYQYPIRC